MGAVASRAGDWEVPLFALEGNMLMQAILIEAMRAAGEREEVFAQRTETDRTGVQHRLVLADSQQFAAFPDLPHHRLDVVLHFALRSENSVQHIKFGESGGLLRRRGQFLLGIVKRVSEARLLQRPFVRERFPVPQGEVGASHIFYVC